MAGVAEVVSQTQAGNDGMIWGDSCNSRRGSMSTGGYMKLEVWKEATELFRLVNELVANNKTIDIRLKSQVIDAAQSVSADISEGYCRRTINEYLPYLSIAMGSLGEKMTRMAGLLSVRKIPHDSFEAFDECHYSVENKLIALIKSLQGKKREGSWEEEFR